MAVRCRGIEQSGGTLFYRWKRLRDSICSIYRIEYIQNEGHDQKNRIDRIVLSWNFILHAIRREKLLSRPDLIEVQRTPKMTFPLDQKASGKCHPFGIFVFLFGNCGRVAWNEKSSACCLYETENIFPAFILVAAPGQRHSPEPANHLSGNPI